MENVLKYFREALAKVNIYSHIGKLVIFANDYSVEDVSKEDTMRAFCQAVGEIVEPGTPVLPRKPAISDKEFIDNIMNSSVGILREYATVISVVESFEIPDENSKVDFVIIHVSGNGVMEIDKPRLPFTGINGMVELVADRYIKTIKTVENLYLKQFKDDINMDEDARSNANLLGRKLVTTILDHGVYQEYEPQHRAVTTIIDALDQCADYRYCREDIKGCFTLLRDKDYLIAEVHQDWASGSYDEHDLMITVNNLREELGLRPYVLDEERNFVLYEEFKYTEKPQIICTFPEFKSDVIQDIIASTEAKVNVADLTIENQDMSFVNFAGEYADNIFVDIINPNRFLLNTNRIYLAAKDTDTGRPLYKQISRY